MTDNTAFLLTLEHYQDIGTYTRHFIFRADRTVSFLPGQFITLHWNHESLKTHRNYSLANHSGYCVSHPNRLELAASYVKNGFASEQLFNMKIGDSLPATGPFGRLILKDEPVNRYLLIATGTGVTPYRTMLAELSQRLHSNKQLTVKLLFGMRYLEDFLYREDWYRFASQHTRFSLDAYYSRSTHTMQENEYKGYVTQVFNHPSFSIDPIGDIAYLCGNPDMIDTTRSILIEKGLATARIRQERYISPKTRK